ncbi:thrombomodulin [Amia ocellicauda]|uniref:thrombomodulin n=1 Tax=Amia ocellicauda TaxID=2972642 RepID=UPI003464342E
MQTIRDLVRVLVVVQFILHGLSQTLKGNLCSVNDCYSVIGDPTDFQTAQDTCSRQNGHLMTVRSSVSNDAISVLISHLKAVFWIGLQLPHGHCTDNTAKLRGYKWTTGDENTDFTNWRDMGSSCSQLCVSVSRDLKWTERPCQEKVDGFLCEYNFNKTCKPLPQVEGESVQYITPLGFTATDLTSIPPGTIVVFNPSEFKAYCADDWIQGPWDCQVENGGCEHQCQMNNSKPQCFCPPGEELKDNKVTCEKMNPCFNSGCEHLCVPHDDGYTCKCPEGYELAEDWRKCRDIDECTQLPDLCEADKICYNVPGTFRCMPPCHLAPCEHTCTPQSKGYTCSCDLGFLPDPKNHHQCLRACTETECHGLYDRNNPRVITCPGGYVREDESQMLCVLYDMCESNIDCNLCQYINGATLCYCNKGYFIPIGKECDHIHFTVGAVCGIVLGAVLVVLLLLCLSYCICKQCAVSEVQHRSNQEFKLKP